MSLVDDIVKFCKDLVLGDFEQEPSNAAMVVGGLISLIPVVDQVMDIRDVAGMIYRINRKGVANCTKDDWVDLALAAFGCVPEIGSLFKTLVKPLWKGRKGLKGALRGAAFIESMLGRAKGRAITFIRAFDWAGKTQQAVSVGLAGVDTCDRFLVELSVPRWWVPDELEGLARDLRPGLRTAKTFVRSGIAQGSGALREFVTELVGEDGYRVVQAASSLAVSSSSGASGRRSNSTRSSSPNRTSTSTSRTGVSSLSSGQPQRQNRPTQTAVRPTDQQRASHPPIRNTRTQDRRSGQGPAQRIARATRAVTEGLSFQLKGLIGEHMAHYHHMRTVISLSQGMQWKHGRVEHHHQDAGWPAPAAIRLVDELGREASVRSQRTGQVFDVSPTELVPDHFWRITTAGIDGVWRVAPRSFHFVEAKFSESAGALFGRGRDDTREYVRKKDGKRIPAKKLAPPVGLTERRVALWYMLGQPNRGLQMSSRYMGRVISPRLWTGNQQNRWVYVIFAIDSASGPADYVAAPGGSLQKHAARGAVEHIAITARVAERMLTGGDVYDLAMHNLHEGRHGVSDSLNAADIDILERAYDRQRLAAAAASPQASTGAPTTPRQRQPRTRRP
jgi:hypothetical protein